MKKLKQTAVLLIILASALLSQTAATAATGKIDLAEWNTQSTLYTVLNDEDIHSNSAVVMAFLRTDYDRPSNRIRMLFSLELDSFTDESKSGVCMRVNGGEDIILRADGTAEYNENEYFASLISDSDPRTKTLYLEVTLGIKKGISDSVVLDFNFYDTEGLASNTYSVDISERAEPSTSAAESKVTAQTKKSNPSAGRKPASQKTETSSTEEKSTDIQSKTHITAHQENQGGEVISVTRKDRAFAVLLVLGTATLCSTGVFYLIRRRNDPKNGG